MDNNHAVISIFPTHQEAESAVIELQKAGFDMHKVSVIGQDYQTLEKPQGFFSWKDTAKSGATEGGYWGSFFGGLFGILTGAGLLFVPGVGQVIIAGPIVGVLAGWLEGLILGGAGGAALGGLTGGLIGLGIPKEKAIRYETELKVGKFLLMVTGSTEDEAQATRIIDPARAKPLVATV